MESQARKSLARHVRLLRTAHGWSQEVLACLSGLHRSYIGAVERAEHNIGIDNIEKIATALELHVRDLFPVRLSTDGITETEKPDPYLHKLPINNFARNSVPARIRGQVIADLLDHPGPPPQQLIEYLRHQGIEVLD